jgi:hypothetical protein
MVEQNSVDHESQAGKRKDKKKGEAAEGREGRAGEGRRMRREESRGGEEGKWRGQRMLLLSFLLFPLLFHLGSWLQG